MIQLTIGIPTLGNRPERLDIAVKTALAQTTPARVVIACQGDSFAEIRKRYRGQRLVKCFASDATCSWENWLACAEACRTKYFAWLQDDDELFDSAVGRMVAGLESDKRNSCWLGRVAFRVEGSSLGYWWMTTGPFVPMGLNNGQTIQFHPAALASGAYVAAHALSPGVAFRCTPKILDSLRSMPPGLDLLNERMVLAAFSPHGYGVCDPAIIGHWVQHEGQESRRLNVIAGEGHRQYRAMLPWLDPIVDAHPPWKDLFRVWAKVVGPLVARNMRSEVLPHAGLSPNVDAVCDILEDTYPELKGA